MAIVSRRRIVRGLQTLADGQWGETLDPRALARLLVSYDVRPKLMRFSDAIVRLYNREDFVEVFGRYLPPLL